VAGDGKLGVCASAVFCYFNNINMQITGSIINVCLIMPSAIAMHNYHAVNVFLDKTASLF
jgi:hypothetical protein